MGPVMQELDNQWLATAASPTARRALIRWGRRHPVLSDLGDLNDVVAARHDPTVVHEVLAALAALAPADELAARTLLQMLLPGLVAMIGTIGQGDRDASGEIVSLAWERIRTYPTTRHGSVAANVVLDVRKRYLALRPDRREVALSLVPEPLDEGPSTEELVLGVLMIEEMADAQHAGVMTHEVLSTILRTRIGGEPLAEVAADRGVDANVLCGRRWRAERRLRDLPLAS